MSGRPPDCQGGHTYCEGLYCDPGLETLTPVTPPFSIQEPAPAPAPVLAVTTTTASASCKVECFIIQGVPLIMFHLVFCNIWVILCPFLPGKWL